MLLRKLSRENVVVVGRAKVSGISLVIHHEGNPKMAEIHFAPGGREKDRNSRQLMGAGLENC